MVLVSNDTQSQNAGSYDDYRRAIERTRLSNSID